MQLLSGDDQVMVPPRVQMLVTVTRVFQINRFINTERSPFVKRAVEFVMVLNCPDVSQTQHHPAYGGQTGSASHWAAWGLHIRRSTACQIASSTCPGGFHVIPQLSTHRHPPSAGSTYTFQHSSSICNFVTRPSVPPALLSLSDRYLQHEPSVKGSPKSPPSVTAASLP